MKTLKKKTPNLNFSYIFRCYLPTMSLSAWSTLLVSLDLPIAYFTGQTVFIARNLILSLAMFILYIG